MEFPTHTLLQISDTHITSGQLLFGQVDTLAQLERSLRIVAEGRRHFDVMLLSGDLANDGQPEEYRRLRAAVEPVAARLGVPVVYMPGNHDDRAAVRTELMDEPAGNGAPIDRVLDLDGLRLILVDSTRPGRGDGFFSEEQAAWLSEVLASPAPAGTVLAIHHPPLPTADEFMAEYAFRDRARFSASIAGSDIRLIVSGHWHQPGGGNLAGYPIWIGGSTATTTAPLAPSTERFVEGSSVSLIELFGDGSVVAQAVPTVESVTIPLDH